jgi:hypothetical protein
MRFPHGTKRHGEAAVRAFVESRAHTGKPIVGLAVLARRPHPEAWLASWVTASGGYCFGKIAVAGAAAGTDMSSWCLTVESGFLTTREPGVVIVGHHPADVRNGPAGQVSVQHLQGFVRGAARVDAVWDGEPVPVVVVPLGVADDPGLSALLLESPAALRSRHHGYSVAAYDAAGVEVGRSGQDALEV